MINTVLGPIAREQLGLVLPHEHLIIDLRNQFTPFADPEKDRVSRQPVGLENVGRLRRNPYAVRDNLVLDDVGLAVRELVPFRRLDGRTVVECTTVGIGRDPLKLRAVAEQTGLQIVAGCGYYTQDTHPPEMAAWSAAELAAHMLRDLQEGIDGTAVRAGVIGEIGTSHPVHPHEWKVLEAAALAHRAVPVPVYVHVYPWCTAGVQTADFLLRHGVAPAKIVICHSDVEADEAYMAEVLRRGVWLEFDNFGKEFWIDPDERGFAGGVFMRDCERVDCLKRLWDRGYGSQLLITNDICLKTMLHAYGGWGYDHIAQHVVPMLRHAGFGVAEIDLLVRGNPVRLLAG